METLGLVTSVLLVLAAPCLAVAGPGDCLELDTVYNRGRAVAERSTRDHAECRAWCQLVRGCEHFSYHTRTQADMQAMFDDACSLSRGEAATHLPGVISGPQHCRGRRPNSSDSRPVCSGAGPREVCLVGAASRHSGNVMVAGRPVCDDEWGLEDAAVVCRQLGFPGVERATRESEFGNVSPLFAMDNVRCGGNESRLDQCRHKAGDDCNGGEAAGVVCALASPAQLPPPCRRRGAVCLAGGGDGHSGNVYFEGQPVCHNGWDFADANVVCKSLGHPGASNFTLGGQFGAATSYFSASGVRCRGDEASLGQCPHLAGGRGCSTEDVAGVVCLKTEV